MLFILGVGKSYISEKSMIKSGLGMVLIGAIITAVAYAVGGIFSI